ncbi:hypothetical protein Tco_0946829 [Tanacetum coccineum]
MQETALAVTPVLVVAPRSAEGTPPKRYRTKKDDTQNMDFKEEITTSASEGLPPGWIKETITKIFATHKRTDPVLYIHFANDEHKSPKFLALDKNADEIPAVKDKNLIEEGNERRRGGTDNLAKNIAEVTASSTTWLGRDLSCVCVQGKEHHTNELASRKNKINFIYFDALECYGWRKLEVLIL